MNWILEYHSKLHSYDVINVVRKGNKKSIGKHDIKSKVVNIVENLEGHDDGGTERWNKLKL